MPDFETALYYTFSTIAQTLAALLGLLSAFLALRINAFNHVIYERMNELHRKLQEGERWPDSVLNELSKHRGRGDAPAYFYALRAKFKEAAAQGGNGSPAQQVLDQEEEEELLTQGESLNERKRRLLTAAKYVIAGSAFVIIFSFGVLPVVPWVKDLAWIAKLLFFIGGGLAAGCVVGYVLMIWRDLTEV